MILVVGKIHNFFVQYSRLGFHVIILYLVLLFAPSISFADITVRVANLKQDMELVTRELAGLLNELCARDPKFRNAPANLGHENLNPHLNGQGVTLA